MKLITLIFKTMMAAGWLAVLPVAACVFVVATAACLAWRFVDDVVLKTN